MKEAKNRLLINNVKAWKRAHLCMATTTCSSDVQAWTASGQQSREDSLPAAPRSHPWRNVGITVSNRLV